MKNLLSNIYLGALSLRKGVFTMKFTKKHRIVRSWVSLINGGVYTMDDVPKLFNLREVVEAVLTEQADEQA